jgi:hypothetical protein
MQQKTAYTKLLEWHWQNVCAACEYYRLHNTLDNKIKVIGKMRNWIKARQSEEIIMLLSKNDIDFKIKEGKILI